MHKSDDKVGKKHKKLCSLDGRKADEEDGFKFFSTRSKLRILPITPHN